MRAVRKRVFCVTGLGALVSAAIAMGATASVSVSVSPNKPKARSAVTMSASSFTGVSGLPMSVEITVQKGFTSSAKSVSVLCSAGQASSSSCPAKSEIGTGEATGTAMFLGQALNESVPLTFYLGRRLQRGDIASVVVTASALGRTGSASGRLFVPSGGGLEILFSSLPNFALPPGTTVTPKSISFTAKALRTVTETVRRHHRKHMVKIRYSLITNPRTCSSGHWTGTLQATFTSASVPPTTFSITCST
jgi:hypothetical protein